MVEITKYSPINNVEILKGVGLNPNYNDCYTFSSDSQRYNFLHAYMKYSITNATPVRHNVIRVPYTQDDLMDCDYIIYENKNFINRKFYAFITNLEWVNAHMTEITFTIDVITTWQLDVVYHPSFIERMHVGNDTLGAWQEPEPLDTGEKLYLQKADTGATAMSYVLYYIPSDLQISIPLVGDIRNMCNVAVQPASADGFKNIYETYIKPLMDVGLQDNILGFCLMPSWIINKTGETTSTGAEFITYTGQLSLFKNLNGYNPSNNKLLTYPFNSLVVASANGLQNEYKIEAFNSSNFIFKLWSFPSIDVVIYGNMDNYANQATNDARIAAMSDINMCSGFPQLLTSGLQSLAYAQNISSGVMNTVLSVIGMGGSIAGGNITGAVSSSASLVDSIVQTYNSVKVPPIAKTGSVPTSTASAVVYNGRFAFIQHCISDVKARTYDKFLTRWGYQVNDVQPLTFRKRKKFDYIKTRGALITGAIPQTHLRIMIDAFDNGITFWHTEKGISIGQWSGAANDNDIG